MPENTMTVTEFARSGGQARQARMTPAERTDLARHAAEIRWARVRAQVAESRKAQGLGETVAAGPVLDQLAAEVLGGGQDAG